MVDRLRFKCVARVAGEGNGDYFYFGSIMKGNKIRNERIDSQIKFLHTPSVIRRCLLQLKSLLLFSISLMLVACGSYQTIAIVGSVSEKCMHLGQVHANSTRGVSDEAIAELKKQVQEKNGDTLECCYAGDPISTWGINQKTGEGSAVEITEVRGEAYICNTTP